MTPQLREPTLVVRGDVPDDMVAYAREKLLEVVSDAPVPVLAAELRLEHYADPARERSDHVEMVIDLDGKTVRAHRHAPTMVEAVDRTVARLRRRTEASLERPQARVLRHRDAESWHHEDRPTERPPVFPRPVDEREIVRRKTFAAEPESIEEALFDLEALDHDFFLFVHAETGSEAVVYRAGDGYGIMQRVRTPDAIQRTEIPLEIGPDPAATTLEQAEQVLDESAAPFEFFIDTASGSGLVVYRRYDGHYGLISPS